MTEKLKKVEDEFLEKKKINWLFGLIKGNKEVKVEKEELLEKSPLLFYWDENMNITVYNNVQTGILRPKNSTGETHDYPHEIISSKKAMLEYGGVEIPIYVQFEKERFPYPVEPKLDAERIYKNTQNLIANYRQREEAEKSGFAMNKSTLEFWGYAIGGILIMFLATVYLGNIFGVWETLFPKEQVVQSVAQTIVNNASSGTVVVP